jgi:hypothetical protein
MTTKGMTVNIVKRRGQGTTDYIVQADCHVSADPDLVVRAHEDRRFAHAFRDIQKYTKFEMRDTGEILTAYNANVGFLKFPMEVVKRVTLDNATGDRYVRFRTTADCLADFDGHWRVRQDPVSGGSIVNLNQTIRVPPWTRWLRLPVESAIRRRIENAISDMDALATAHVAENP